MAASRVLRDGGWKWQRLNRAGTAVPRGRGRDPGCTLLTAGAALRAKAERPVLDTVLLRSRAPPPGLRPGVQGDPGHRGLGVEARGGARGLRNHSR